MITLFLVLVGLIGTAIVKKTSTTPQTQVTTGMPVGKNTPDFHPTSQVVRATSQMVLAGQFQGGPSIFNPRYNKPATTGTGGPQSPTGGPSAPAYGGAGGTGTGGIGRGGRVFFN